MKSKEQLAAEQAEFWNGPGGKMWLAAYARIERGIQDFGEAALAAADARPGERVLDIGCGTGGTTAALARAVGAGGRVLGVDISEPLVGAARAQGLANATFEIGDAAAWPIQGLITHFRGEIEKRIDQYAANPHSDPVRVAAE